VHKYNDKLRISGCFCGLVFTPKQTLFDVRAPRRCGRHKGGEKGHNHDSIKNAIPEDAYQKREYVYAFAEIMNR
jgi:hypothetical protein